jgi:Multiubiquitin
LNGPVTEGHPQGTGAFQTELSRMNVETPSRPNPGQNHTPEQEAEGRGSGGDDHGHDHQVTIIVNARAKTWTEKDISFEQVVKLAFPTPPPGENIVYTVTYRKGEGHKPEGTLTQGESVKVKDGMIFNVTATDKS